MNDASIADRLHRLREEIDAHAHACGRDPREIELLVVTKQQPVVRIVEAIAAGVTQIGENYLQEARAKLGALPPVRRHFIGHLQTNKAKSIVELFDCVQSVDRIDVVHALDRAATTVGKRLSVLLQVNISPTERFGSPPEQLGRLSEAVRASRCLDLDGVMAIGPTDPAEVAASFALASACARQIGGSILSLGMSGDWREAIGAGSTMIRLGTAIFGPRGAI